MSKEESNVTKYKLLNSKEILKQFEEKIELHYMFGQDSLYHLSSFNEKDLFYYIYASLYSRSYREKYADFLKADFPRVPFAKDKTTFWRMVRIGESLVETHLLKQKLDCIPEDKFVDNGRTVQRAIYKNGCVFINSKSYFKDVDEDDWKFLIGGYAPLQYWFKDRKNTKLSEDELIHYISIIRAIKRTRSLMDEIDEVVVYSNQ